MNKVSIDELVLAVDVDNLNTEVEVQLVPTETVQYGFMGLQTYEGVEVIVDD